MELDFIEYLFLIQSSEIEKKYDDYKKKVISIFRNI